MTLTTTVELGISKPNCKHYSINIDVISQGKQAIMLCAMDVTEFSEIIFSDDAIAELIFHVVAIRGLTANSPLAKLLDLLADCGLVFTKGVGHASLSPLQLQKCLNATDKNTKPQGPSPKNPEADKTGEEPVIGNNEPVQ